MKQLSNTEGELKKSVAYKKACTSQNETIYNFKSGKYQLHHH